MFGMNVVKFLFVAAVVCSTARFLSAAPAPEEYSPTTDVRVKKLPRPEFDVWGAAYMWYPGQLASYLHKKLASDSVERCNFVFDGGTYFTPSEFVVFEREVYFEKETVVKWRTPQKTEFFIDGEKTASGRNGETPIKSGKHSLRFEVFAKGRLPCLIVEGVGVSSPEGWNSSLDGENKVPAESSPIFNDALTTPDRLVYDLYEIPPRGILKPKNCAVKNGSILLKKGGSVIVDFWHIELGSVSLKCKGNGTLSFYAGESVAEAENDNVKTFEQKPLPKFSLSGTAEKIVLPETALRYLRIETDGDCEASDIVFTAKLYPAKRTGFFRCSDERFNRIFEAGVATIHSSTRGFYLDGIKRDFLPWPLDAIESTLAADYVFDARQVSRNGYSLSLLSDKPTVFGTGILDYPLHALVGFRHDYARFGDIKTSEMYRPRIVQLFDFYDSILDERGFLPLRKTKWPFFLPGWSKVYPKWKGTPAYVQIMLYENWKTASKFFGLWGDNVSQEKYSKKAEKLKSDIMKYFWDSKRGVFINGFDKHGELDTGVSHYAQYWGILADIFPESAVGNLFENVLPNLPKYREDISIEKAYEIAAYTKVGRVRDAYNLISEVWGGWLDEGHSRFPENFSPKASESDKLKFYGRPFGLSLCHASLGAPPIIAAFRGICGFSETENPDEYVLKPNLLDFQWIQAEIPVRKGSIKFRLERGGKLNVCAPSGVKIFLPSGVKVF